MRNRMEQGVVCVVSIVALCGIVQCIWAGNPKPTAPAPVPNTPAQTPASKPLLSYYVYDAAFVGQYPSEPVERVLTACTFQKMAEFVQRQQQQIMVLEKRVAELEKRLKDAPDWSAPANVVTPASAAQKLEGKESAKP